MFFDNGKNTGFEIENVNLGGDFTLSFWFKNILNTQTNTENCEIISF